MSEDRRAWTAPSAGGPLDAKVVLPGSKSLTNRFLVLASLANDQSRLRMPLRSRDTLLMVDALRALGVGIDDIVCSASGSLDWVVTPGALHGDCDVDVGLAGTVMRFLPPVAALSAGSVSFDGDPRARARPMGPVIDALRALGVLVDDAGRGALPFRVAGDGRVRGGHVTLDASGSSQFVSGLLLAGARYDEGVRVQHQGAPVPSQPHIAMTVQTLQDAGVDVDDSQPDVWCVAPGEINALEVQVEPDLSNAGPFLAAALVAGGTVRVPGWPQHTTQAGDALREILDGMGAEVTLDRGGLSVRGEGSVVGIDTDLRDASELTPIVAALAAVATSPSRIRGVGHIRGHETDRIGALATEINRLGGDVTETEDGLHVRPRPLHGGRFRTYHDHRLAMAGAVLGLVTPGITIEDVDTTAKTLPGFVDLWDAMLAAAVPAHR